MATRTIERAVAELDALFPGRFASLTSFKHDGTAVATPLWFASDGERLFALTDAGSAKVARIRHDPHVLVAPCRSSGKLRADPLPARAEVLTETADLDRVQRLLTGQYPLSYRLMMLAYGLGRRLRRQSRVPAGAAVAVTLD
jgi:PPOX class probable F420-dependent enzyme